MTTTNTNNTVTFSNAFEMYQYLIAQGGDPNVSMQLAVAQFAQADTQPVAAKVEEGKPAVQTEVKKEVPKSEEKGWFKTAVSKMNVFKKDELEGRLVMLKLQEKDPKVKAEIEAELVKLRSDKGEERFGKMKDYIAKTKGWATNSTGKVADGVYVFSDFTEKAGTSVTKGAGKTIKVTGEAIAKVGGFIEDNAGAVGKTLRMPTDLIGDTIHALNGTKKKSTK